MGELDPLVQWLIKQCEERNLSWSEASRRAGLSENTISQAVNGVSVGPKRLTALAEFFEVSPEHLFRLARLLPPAPGDDELEPEIRYRLQEVARRLRHLSAEEREEITRQYLAQLDFALALKGVQVEEEEPETLE